MSLVSLQRRWSALYSSLFTEGFLDAQFGEIAHLQDDTNPNFVTDVANMFIEESEIIINDLTVLLNQPTVDFQTVHAHVHKFKGTCSSFGAGRLRDVCEEFRSINDLADREGCLRQLQLMKQEYHQVKSKLQTLFSLQQQIVASGGSVQM